MIEAGTRLGPYEVLAPIGAGGMGEVYRARDTRLGRDVALKVLPPAVASDADRLRRFEQEARAASALQHPNILAVHDVGSENGTPYLVTELLDGESLRQRLAGGKLSPKKVIDYAVQIARGLAAAHEKGIVHRDLKPDNVFVTRDGQVKILDFGLAKLTQSPSINALTEAPTAKMETHPGAVMGTAGYMAPEQVRGEAVDHRADLFALGTILYEMLTGRRAFQRGTSVETMNAILNDEPPPLTDLNVVAAPGLERLIDHCLEKHADNRFQSARDLAFDLEAISGVSTTSAGRRALLGRRKIPAIPLLAVLALMIAVGAVAFFLGKRSVRQEPATFERLTFRREYVANARFAADGKTIVYTAFDISSGIATLITRLGSTDSSAMERPETLLLSISRKDEMAILVNARFIGGHQFEGTLARVPMVGGAPRELVERVHWADWGPDAENLAAVRSAEGKTTLEYPLGKALYATPGWVSHARISPDGSHVAFIDHPALGDDRGKVMVVDLNGKNRTLTEEFGSAQGVAWNPDGREIWFTATMTGVSRSLYAVDFDANVRMIVSAPDTLTLHDISPDGTALVMQAQQRLGMAVGGAAGERDLSWLDWSLAGDLSDDVATAIFSESGEGGGKNYSVFLRKTDGSPAVRLGDGGGGWLSPDGKYVLATLPALSPAGLMVYPTGAGEPRRIPTAALNCQGAEWLPDGKRILVGATESTGGQRMYLGSLDGGSFKPVTSSGIRIRGRRPVAPDGKRMVALNTAREFAVYDLESQSETVLKGVSPDLIVSGWSADSKRVYFSDLRQAIAVVYQYDLVGGELKRWRELPMSFGAANYTALILTPDATTYLYTYVTASSDLYLLHIN